MSLSPFSLPRLPREQSSFLPSGRNPSTNQALARFVPLNLRTMRRQDAVVRQVTAPHRNGLTHDPLNNRGPNAPIHTDSPQEEEASNGEIW
jgi:hypothetical protein